MIHHKQQPPPPSNHSHSHSQQYHQHSTSNHYPQQPYDHAFDNRTISYHPHNHANRSPHLYNQSQHSQQHSINSPPSFYSIPPPPPAPMSMDHAHNHYDAYHQTHSQGQLPLPPPPPPAPPSGHFPMQPPQSPVNSFYSVGTASPHQSYMSHYPPPPSPAPQVIATTPSFPSSFDQRDRLTRRHREGAEFSDYKSSAPPFHPLDYQRQFVYEVNGPMTQNNFNQMANGSTQSKGKSSYPNHSTDLQYRKVINTSSGEAAAAAAAAARKGSVSESHAMALSDQQPTYRGHIKSANDAILLLSACDLKWPPSSSTLKANSSASMASSPPRRVTRRLLDSERADLVSCGSVFVWDEKEAGMKRWTDGRVWSASRVSGCFLTYRELEARKKVGSSGLNDGPCTNQYKPEGLIKQSFSITTTSGRKLHVISYFTKRAVREGRIRRVSEDPRFVGEGGGEWGLKIDDKEYSFPDISQLAKPGMEGSHQGIGLRIDRGDDDSSSLSDSFENETTTSPLPNQYPMDSSKFPVSASPAKEEFDRKRPLPNDVTITDSYRALSRPRLARLRSSSMSGLQSFREDETDPSSYNSNTSLATTVPSDSETVLGRGGKFTSQSSYGKSLKANNRSSAVRALLSPTLPRESALRQSACDMKPTQSQDNANAVGALLSLAGNSDSNESSSSPVVVKGTDTKSIKTIRETSSTATPSSNSSPSGQQGVNSSDDQKGPKRRESDRAALNQFSVRL